jgi:hypothetical protein
MNPPKHINLAEGDSADVTTLLYCNKQGRAAHSHALLCDLNLSTAGVSRTTLREELLSLQDGLTHPFPPLNS